MDLGLFIFAVMNYQQTIDYLYSQLPMFSRIGAIAYKTDLHNTIELCKALDDPQHKFKTIHIAGTNGKGSTSHMLAAILQQAGYKTGLYTSPHLKDFRERIKINGAMIPEAFVTDFVQRTKALSEKVEPSFFELTVAMAFDYFAREKVDIAIIETGLGGRLDSTNIITPILSIITNIGWDHMNILGDSLEKIALEKAGIIKPGVPIVVGKYLPITKNIFLEKAMKENAPIHFVQDKYKATNIKMSAYALSCIVTNSKHSDTETFSLDLNGLYQTNNLCTVLCAEGILMELGFDIKNEVEKYALANVKKLTGLFGRWQVLQEQPLLILDVAHNVDGIKQVMRQLHSFYPDKKTHFVMGMVKDKEIDAVLKLLPANAAYYFTNAHIPRALAAEDLQTKASTYQLNGDCFDNVNLAIVSAKLHAAKDDIIIVCGSVFLVGEVDE
jgi:dihydrofolate synthase/folylpolyglutamate synthase